jgi:hypothetical protein
MLSPVLLLFITVIVVLLLLINVLDLSWLGAGDVHPCGAHKATGNEAGAVDVAEDKSHQLQHEFVHHPPLLVVVFMLWSLLSGSFLSCQS